MTTQETVDRITLDVGEIKITIRDIRVILEGKQLKGIDRLLFKLLGGKTQ